MAVTQEKYGRDIRAVFSVGLSALGTMLCTAKQLPGLEPGTIIDATTDDASQVVSEKYAGQPGIQNAVLTTRQDMDLFEKIKDASIAHTEGILTFTSAFTSKTLTIAVCTIGGVIFNSVDNDGLPAMEITVLCRGGVTNNEPKGA